MDSLRNRKKTLEIFLFNPHNSVALSVTLSTYYWVSGPCLMLFGVQPSVSDMTSNIRGYSAVISFPSRAVIFFERN
jgi:hypothetical protein